MKNVLFLHLVTTDNQPDTCDLIELSGRLVRMDDERTMREFHVQRRPAGVLTPEASASNGWTNPLVQKLPEISMEQVAETVAPYLSRAHYLCAHGGLAFHFRALYQMFKSTGVMRGFNRRTVFDTFLMAKKWKPDLPSYQLRALAYRFGFPEVMGDTPELVVDGGLLVAVVQRLWERVVFEEFGGQVGDADLEGLVRWQYEPPVPVMFSFGPYRGQLFSVVFREHPEVLRYYLDQGWLPKKYPGDYQAMLRLLRGDR